MVLTASMIGALHENDNEGKKLASLLVISLSKAFSDIPLSLHTVAYRWWWNRATYLSWWPSFFKDFLNVKGT